MRLHTHHGVCEQGAVSLSLSFDVIMMDTKEVALLQLLSILLFAKRGVTKGHW